jgi:hypothetical protein
MKYQEVLNKVYDGDFSRVPDRLLCLDPGETTGWCLFRKGQLTEYDQIATVNLSDEGKQGSKVLQWKPLIELFRKTQPTYVVCENYRVYAHKLERHSNSQVETLRLIGGIDLICSMTMHISLLCDAWFSCDEYKDEHAIPITYQMAAQAKGFITDERLKDWDFWKPGMKHSRDAIRHGLYFLIITNRG